MPEEAVLHVRHLIGGRHERQEELARWESRDMGAPISETRALDVPRSAEVLRFFAEWATNVAGGSYARPEQGTPTYTLREPLGGFKSSGIGREGGDHSLVFHTESKAVVLRTGG